MTDRLACHPDIVIDGRALGDDLWKIYTLLYSPRNGECIEARQIALWWCDRLAPKEPAP